MTEPFDLDRLETLLEELEPEEIQRRYAAELAASPECARMLALYQGLDTHLADLKAATPQPPALPSAAALPANVIPLPKRPSFQRWMLSLAAVLLLGLFLTTNPWADKTSDTARQTQVPFPEAPIEEPHPTVSTTIQSAPSPAPKTNEAISPSAAPEPAAPQTSSEADRFIASDSAAPESIAQPSTSEQTRSATSDSAAPEPVAPPSTGPTDPTVVTDAAASAPADLAEFKAKEILADPPVATGLPPAKTEPPAAQATLPAPAPQSDDGFAMAGAPEVAESAAPAFDPSPESQQLERSDRARPEAAPGGNSDQRTQLVQKTFAQKPPTPEAEVLVWLARYHQQLPTQTFTDPDLFHPNAEIAPQLVQAQKQGIRPHLQLGTYQTERGGWEVHWQAEPGLPAGKALLLLREGRCAQIKAIE